VFNSDASCVMIGQAISHYTILEKLGEGGMGVVYRARDLTLHRDVALKFLNVDAKSDPMAHVNILQEARTISALNHPNICTIYEVGEAEGHPYLVMEFIEGRTLAAEMTSVGMAADVVMRYGMQLADALAHAHERGIVHRDLKAGNVIVTPSGRLKVLDFGLSRRIEQDVGEDTTQVDRSWDEQHSITGTLAYMAPELLKGQEADARSDIWALGVLLYELAAGRRPFRGGTAYELSAAILREAPLTITPVLPPVLQSVIDKCLDKDRGQRYHSGGEVRAGLEAAATASRSERIPIAALARHETALKSARAQRQLWYGLATLAVIVAATAGLLWRASHPRRPPFALPGAIQSLAVLPLENLSGDPAQDYFSDGMTDALITELSQIRKLRVISRTSVMQYKRTQKPIANIARDLNVDAVVEGSVVRSNGRVRISAKLIQISSVEQNLWADSYERDFTDVLALQSDVATAVARGIQVELSAPERSQLASRRTVVPEAYETFLKGRFEAEKRSPQGLTNSSEYFKEAIAKDPTYAAAYAGLASSFLHLGTYELRPPAEVMPAARTAAEKALELDEGLAEAHATLAAISFYHLDWDNVEAQFKRAIALDPGYATAMHWYALSLAAMGRRQESITEIKLARDIDPRSLIINANVGWCYYLAGDMDRAIEEEKNTLRLGPDFIVAHGYLGQAYLEKKLYEMAIEEFRQTIALAPGDMSRKAELANAFAQAGKTDQAQEILQEFLQAPRERYVSAYDGAMIYAGAANKQETLTWLERAYEERNPRLANIAVHPRFAFLRGDTRFESLLARMNVPANLRHAALPAARARPGSGAKVAGKS
jgi:TolB-like protein/tetratricopeptide (TPR) repeat protein/tRNA A-37 threonylcarbamoyl transferase component Bud32